MNPIEQVTRIAELEKQVSDLQQALLNALLTRPPVTVITEQPYYPYSLPYVPCPMCGAGNEHQ